eukprot:Gb_38771 [translate_table: standard]
MANIKRVDVETYGPWGGRGGSPWDDGSHKHVKAITLTFDEPLPPPWIGSLPLLRSIQVDYVAPSGEVVKGPKHGGNGKRTHKVEFNPPCDVLAKIRGLVFGDCVKALSFERDEPPCPPIERDDPPFPPIERNELFESSPGKEIVGFYGHCADGCIKAIGIYGIRQHNEEPKLLQCCRAKRDDLKTPTPMLNNT